jgi:hypothetical protein
MQNFQRESKKRMVNRSDLGGDVTARCVERDMLPSTMMQSRQVRRTRSRKCVLACERHSGLPETVPPERVFFGALV